METWKHGKTWKTWKNMETCFHGNMEKMEKSNEPVERIFLKWCVYTMKYYTIIKMNQLYINMDVFQKHC